MKIPQLCEHNSRSSFFVITLFKQMSSRPRARGEEEGPGLCLISGAGVYIIVVIRIIFTPDEIMFILETKFVAFRFG